MTADAYEVRPPQVSALRWTPDEIGTVGRFFTWAQFAGAQPAIVADGDGQQRVTASAVLVVRTGPGSPSVYLRPGEWLVLDQRHGGRFIVRTDQQFRNEYREQQ